MELYKTHIPPHYREYPVLRNIKVFWNTGDKTGYALDAESQNLGAVSWHSNQATHVEICLDGDIYVVFGLEMNVVRG